jgi:hypothetical protein
MSTFATHWRASALLVPAGNSKTSDGSNGFLNRTGGSADSAAGGAAGGAELGVLSATAGGDGARASGRCAALPRAITAAAMPRTPVIRASGHLLMRGASPANELSSAEAGSAQVASAEVGNAKVGSAAVGLMSTGGTAACLTSKGRDNASRSLGLNSNSMVSSSKSSANCGEPTLNAFVIAPRYQGLLGATREFITFLTRDSVPTAHNAPEDNRPRHQLECMGPLEL